MAGTAAGGIREMAPLARLESAALQPVLEEEIRAWREQLLWDFSASAELVKHYIDVRILNGFALLEEGGEAAGYSYFVIDEHKGLIGDLYVRRRWRTAENEHRLLAAVVDALFRAAGVRRIESQLMMLAGAHSRALPHAAFAHAHPRNFMMAPLERVEELPGGRAAGRLAIEKWSERYHEEAARVIASAYYGHVDSQINSQYHSTAGARRFLHNIVEYPGCGNFFEPASYVAFERETGEACGVSLASLVAAEVGHITQICVVPRMRGTGAGYELLRRSLVALREYGCDRVSLTVTAANEGAVRLYERVGFHTARQFDALVWDGF